jgi:hypothetical protein
MLDHFQEIELKDVNCCGGDQGSGAARGGPLPL